MISQELGILQAINSVVESGGSESGGDWGLCFGGLAVIAVIIFFTEGMRLSGRKKSKLYGPRI